MYSPSINLLARSTAAIVLAIVLGLGSCAHDANTGLNIVPYPNEVRIAWAVRGIQFSPNYWYYTVFNLSRSPSTTQLDRPLDEISNENRAENWELYVGFHPGTGSPEIFTKQIPTGPTVIGTAEGPSCTTTFDADGNTYGDIAVTCADGGVTQLVRAIAVQENLLLPIYFRPVDTIDTGIRPWRCHNYDYNADGNRDVVVLDQGNAGTAPFIRVLTGDGSAGFTALANQPLGSDVLIDSVMDEFNNDAIGDLAVLTSNAAGNAWSLTVYLGNEDGTFAAGTPIDAGDNALALQSGFITSGIDSIVVADEGTGSADGAVRVFDVAVDAGLTARLEIPIPGRVFSAGFGAMFGSNQDIVACWQDGTTGEGRAGAFITDSDGATSTTPVQFSTANNIPTYIVATETGNNSNTDVVLVMGDPDNLDQLLYIQEGGRFVPDSGSITSEFAWVNDTISYLSGLQPTRIEVANVDVNGKLDLVVPNSSLDEGGDSISIYYGLGKNNYTTAERYWTDDLPALLGSTTQWYVNAQFTNNQFALIIDPNVFYDQALQRPDNMVVQFFTCDRGITLTDNQDQLGIVLDKLNDPVNIPMEVGFFTDEQINPQARTNQYSDADADVDDWQIQVN